VARLAAALALALGALEHQLRADQVLDQPAHGAAPHSHEAREVRPRDRLSRANEIERDLTVDLAGSPTARDAERCGADSAHLNAPSD
jgi:hypothetical protein